MSEVHETKVMVIEDYEGMRMLIGRCLADLGYVSVRLKANADEALAALCSEQFDLIICDYQLGNGDGLQFLKSIRDNPATGDTKFIMLTGSDDRDILRKAVEFGVNEYITKPVEPRKLKESISRALGAGR